MVKIVQQPDNEMPTEILANHIVEISRGIGKLRSGRLNERCLLTLLHDLTGLPKGTIQKVLDGLNDLEKKYVRKVNG